MEDKRKADFIIEDPKEPVRNRAVTVSAFVIAVTMIVLLVLSPVLLLYDDFTATQSIKALEGWYEGRLEYETAENDPHGVYDDFPRYLIAGRIPVLVHVRETGEGLGRLKLYDSAQEVLDIDYRIWIEEGKLMGEPLDPQRDIASRLDLFGNVAGGASSRGIKGSLGIKDLSNQVIAIFNLHLDRKSADPSENYQVTNDKEFEKTEAEVSAGLDGVWLDIASAEDLRFGIVNSGSVVDPLKGQRIYFHQPGFIMLFMDREYEILPYSIVDDQLRIEAEYWFTKAGKILVHSDTGTWLVDTSVFDQHELMKVKLGEMKEGDLERVIQVEGVGTIDPEQPHRLILHIELSDEGLDRSYDLELEKFHY